MKSRNLLPVVLLCLLASCGEDYETPTPFVLKNNNANDASIPYATRLEMPHLKGGADNIFLVHTCEGYDVNYAIEWNVSKKAQRWSAYMCCDQNNVTNWNRNYWSKGDSNGKPFLWQGSYYPTQDKGDPFMEDPELPAGTCATLDMHRSNGYDRGHIVASADRLMSMEANGQTYFLSNMHPQLASFNQSGGLWYNMENMVRTWNDKKVNSVAWRDTMWVVKGGLIDNVGYNANSGDCFMLANKENLVVPNYFFVAVLVKKHGDKTQGGYAGMGFFFKHTDGRGSDLNNYAYSIDQIEARTGLDFFCNMPDDIENQVEANYVPSVWGLQENKNEQIPY